MIRITDVMNESECFKRLRKSKWVNDEVICPRYSSNSCVRIDEKSDQSLLRKYKCKACNRHFNDLTNTIFQSSNLPLKTWYGCIYLLGLNVSNRQIAQEIGVSEKTAQNMADKIRAEIDKNRERPILEGNVEFDEVYIVSGHKGLPDTVKKRT